MRILNLNPHLGGGGAERQFSYLGPELVRMGHEVHIAYSRESVCKPELPGVVLHKLKSRTNYDPYLLWQLVRLIRDIKPDIVHTWIPQMDILGGIAAKLAGVPYVFREPSSSLGYCPSWKNSLRVLIGSGARAIVANSSGGKEYWRIRLPNKRCYVVLNGLPLQEIGRTPAALPLGFPQLVKPIILYVGRLVALKRLKVFLEILARINQERQVLGVLCGEGPQQAELEVLARQLGLEGNIYFTGHLIAPSVWALMKKADVFVSLSTYEGCPNTVMEAMVCGCPLVLSDIPAHREILDEGCALFVDASNISQVADSIVQMLGNIDTLKSRALIAKQKTREWSITAMAENWVNVYTDILHLPHVNLP